jgi:hypothetical protein
MELPKTLTIESMGTIFDLDRSKGGLMTRKHVLLPCALMLTILMTILAGCGGLDAQTNPGGGGGGGGGSGPVTTISSGPDHATTATTAQFSFSCNKSSCTFECKLDAADFSACTSPQSYNGLATGGHTFTVRATDSSSNVESNPPTYSWTIGGGGDTPITNISSGPDSLTSATDATFAFSCDRPPCTFECKLDAADFSACSSPQSYNGLAEGGHNFTVRAKDSHGSVETNPPSWPWTIFSGAATMDAIGYFTLFPITENQTEVYWGVPVNLNSGATTVSLPIIGQSLAMSVSGVVKDPGTGYNVTLSGSLSGGGMTITSALRSVPGHAPFTVYCLGSGALLNGILDLLVSDYVSDPADLGKWLVTIDWGAHVETIEPLMGDMRQVMFNHNSAATTPISQGTWNYERKVVFTSKKSEWDTGTANFSGDASNPTFNFSYNSEDSSGASSSGSAAIAGWTVSADGHKLTKTGNDGYCLGASNCAIDAFGYVSENVIAIHEKLTPPGAGQVLYSTIILSR